jgi:DNA repair protein RadC
MKRIDELYVEDKPREKLLKKGADVLKNYELIAVLLGSGIKGKDVLKLSREIEGVLKDIEDITLEKLLSIKGLGVAKASQIVAALELSKRLLLKNHLKIEKTEDIITQIAIYYTLIFGKDEEKTRKR